MSEYYLYHYFEQDFGPFVPLTALPIDEARAILTKQRAIGKFHNPDIEGFLHKRYERDKQLRDKFIQCGGRPNRENPVYFFLGEHRQWESAYENPDVVKIPLGEFDPMTVSYTYGDSFTIFNPALFGEEEYWNKICFADEIIEVIKHHGFPLHVEYDFKRGIYPKDKHLNNHLKYLEAHVWDNAILDKYRVEWIKNNLSIKNAIKENLAGDALKNAQEFAAFLRANEMQFERSKDGYWADKRYWLVKYKNEYVCFIMVNGTEYETEPEGWAVWSDNSDSNWYADAPMDEHMKKIV